MQDFIDALDDATRKGLISKSEAIVYFNRYIGAYLKAIEGGTTLPVPPKV